MSDRDSLRRSDALPMPALLGTESDAAKACRLEAELGSALAEMARLQTERDAAVSALAVADAAAWAARAERGLAVARSGLLAHALDEAMQRLHTTHGPATAWVVCGTSTLCQQTAALFTRVDVQRDLAAAGFHDGDADYDQGATDG